MPNFVSSPAPEGHNGSTSCRQLAAAPLATANERLRRSHGGDASQSTPAKRVRMFRKWSGRPWPPSVSPVVSTWTWRCGPLDWPVLPTRPRNWPASTRTAVVSVAFTPGFGHSAAGIESLRMWA